MFAQTRLSENLGSLRYQSKINPQGGQTENLGANKLSS